MRNAKTMDQPRSVGSRAYERLTPESAALLLVDHQSGLVSGVRDLAPDEVRHNVIAFARAARLLRVPVVLTSTALLDSSKNALLRRVITTLAVLVDGVEPERWTLPHWSTE